MFLTAHDANVANIERLLEPADKELSFIDLGAPDPQPWRVCGDIDGKPLQLAQHRALILGWRPFSLSNVSHWSLGNPLSLHRGEGRR
jgi:hypothetical protein